MYLGIQQVNNKVSLDECSATGYMLMYRRMDREDNSIIIDNTLINDDLRKIIQGENEKMLISIWKPKEKSIIFTFNINCDVKFLTACKSDTVYDLKKAVLREYKMDGWENDRNFRMRVISQNQFFQDSFTNEDITLEEADIYNNRIYSLELKNDSNEFEDYNEKYMNIMIYFWDLKMSDFEYKTLKINKYKLMMDLKQYIIKSFGINTENLFCFKKIDVSSNQYNLIEIFDKTNQNMPIYSNIIEGMKIYVEVLDEKANVSNFKKVKINK